MASLNKSFREYLEHMQTWIDGYPSWLVELAAAGGGMLIGCIIIKRWWRTLFPFIIGCIAMVWLLHGFELINLKKLSLAKDTDIESLMQAAGIWLQEHPIACIAGVVGFCLGWMLS